ncbi:hypothetical protein ACP70R_050231 [Stipagrostis hirtigluma subsp. patula]
MESIRNGAQTNPSRLDSEFPQIQSLPPFSSVRMAGRRDRRRAKLNVDPLSRLQQQPEEEDDDEAWTQSDKRAMRRDLFNLILNSLWYAAAFPLPLPPTDDDDSTADDVLLSTDGIARICHRSLDGLLASLRHYCPSLSTGDALCQLMYADANLAEAVALANGTSKSSALLAMESRNFAAL